MTSGRPHVLFVCTGNTCRSPLAEVIAREMWAERARVSSAGTLAEEGAPASTNSIRVAAELGLDLTGFRSTPLTDTPKPDLVLSMEAFHVDASKERFPDLPANAIGLLDPAGIEDPIGGPLDAYRQVAIRITAALEAVELS